MLENHYSEVSFKITRNRESKSVLHLKIGFVLLVKITVPSSDRWECENFLSSLNIQAG